MQVGERESGAENEALARRRSGPWGAAFTEQRDDVGGANWCRRLGQRPGRRLGRRHGTARREQAVDAGDKVDRYDYDGDGVYMEPDGYIDHFQDIHAGEGEEAGGGAQGEDAIWSHRWYAFSDGIGSTGPANFKGGGVQIGNSGIWVGDYTTEPENGGLGVFTHEFGHDLGLADYYDTAGGDNSTAFWTLMSSGSWLNTGGDSIGTKPGYMGPHEKLLLGWLDYALVKYGQNRNVRVGPADQDGYQMPRGPGRDSRRSAPTNYPRPA